MLTNLEKKVCLTLCSIHFLSKMTKEMANLLKTYHFQGVAVNWCQLEKEI